MENKPQIPTLKESRKDDKKGAPPLRIKGLQSGQSLIERLKMFKKKDLAFILSGLGVLFMAPLAEHFMMSPSDQGNGAMTEGWNTPGKGGSVFGNGSSPYEPGISGLAPGGAVGNGSDVITPLNVRDPSALVMGPGQTAQAPATTSQPSAAPPPPPSSKDDSKWNDAIAAGKAAASAATKKAALPVPHIPLSAGGLRGLGAVSGGTGASFSLAAPSSNGLASGHVNQSNGLTGTSGSGFKGVARGPNTGGTGNLEKLKQAAASAGGDFNRAGSATTALEQAANRDMGGGSGGGAGEGGSSGDKATSGSQNKDSKSPGESLEFLRQKMQMEKDIAFADELRKNDPSCLFNFKTPCMERNKIFAQGEETLISKGLVEPIAGAMGDAIKGWLEPDTAGTVTCCKGGDLKAGPCTTVPKPGPCGKAAGKEDKTGGLCLYPGNILGTTPSGTYQGGDYYCSAGTGDGKPQDPKKVDGADGTPEANLDKPWNGGPSLSNICNEATGALNTTQASQSGAAVVQTGSEAARKAAYTKLKGAAADLSALKKEMTGRGDDATACGAPSPGLPTSTPALNARLDTVRQKMRHVVGVLHFTVINNDNKVAGANASGDQAPLWKADADGKKAINDFFSQFGTPIPDPSAGSGTPNANANANTNTNSAAADNKQGLYIKSDVQAAQTKFTQAFAGLQTTDLDTADNALKPYLSPVGGQDLAGVQTELSNILSTIDQTQAALNQIPTKAAAANQGLDPNSDVGKKIAPEVAQIQGEASQQLQQYLTSLRTDQSTLNSAYTKLVGMVGAQGDVTKAHNDTYAGLTAAHQATSQNILGATPESNNNSFEGQAKAVFSGLANGASGSLPTDQTALTAYKTSHLTLINGQSQTVQTLEQKVKTTGDTVQGELNKAGTDIADFDQSLKGRGGTPAAITTVEPMPTAASNPTGGAGD